MAQRDLETGNARTALVARRFVDAYLGDDDHRGITDGDRFPLEQFEAVVHHEHVGPDAVTSDPVADD